MMLDIHTLYETRLRKCSEYFSVFWKEKRNIFLFQFFFLPVVLYDENVIKVQASKQKFHVHLEVGILYFTCLIKYVNVK